MTVYGEAS